MAQNRGAFLFSAASALAGALLPNAGLAANAAPPISASAALKNLLDGNVRFSTGRPRSPATIETVSRLAAGQTPFATVLGCADSRVPVETIFDHDPGDIFTVRIAGNFASNDAAGSIEYATAELKSPLVMVLGHTSCGAAKAGMEYAKTGKPFPGHIQGLAAALAPAAKAAQHQPGDWLHNTIVENVRLNVHKLRESDPILAAAVAAGTLEVVGAVYDLRTGKVMLV